MVNIIVNGIGTIGKRVSWAIKNQNDMNLVGISDHSAKSVLTSLSTEGFLQDVGIYASEPEIKNELNPGGIEIDGQLSDLLEEGNVDVVVDCTPSGVDAKNKELYEDKEVKAIYQGGADKSLAEVSFSTLANYDEAWGKDFVKVVSCNTTSLARTVGPLNEKFGVNGGSVSLVRRGGDPHQENRGPINSIIPVPHVPSHHGVDLEEVLPEVELDTLAVKVPTTLAHVHMVSIKLDESIDRDDILDTFRGTPRVDLFSAEKGFTSTAKIMEVARDLNRPRSDFPEVGIWKDTVTVKDGNKAYWIHMVHQESIVVPENIDAIRSMSKMDNKEEAINKTDSMLPY